MQCGCRWVHWGSLGSFRIVGLIQVCPGGQWLDSASLRSFGCTLGVVGFIRVRWVHSCALWGSLVSFMVVGLFSVRTGGRWVCYGAHQGSWGSFRVVGLPWGSFGFIRGGLVR